MKLTPDEDEKVLHFSLDQHDGREPPSFQLKELVGGLSEGRYAGPWRAC